MIEWPHEDAQTEGASRVLELFKKTGFAAQLEEDTHTWTFRSWARSPEAPARMLLRNDAGESRAFVREVTGLWRVE